MRLQNIVLAVAAAAMTATPVLANPASKLSVAPAAARASAEPGESKLAGTGLIIALVVAAIVVIVVVADGDSDSP